jgi:hypothetical protein
LLPFGQAKGRIKRNYQTLRQAQDEKKEEQKEKAKPWQNGGPA